MQQSDAFILQNTAIYRDELVRLLTQRFSAPGVYETAVAPCMSSVLMRPRS